MAEEKRGYSISNIYQGSYSSFNPESSSYASIGGSDNYMAAGSFGMTTDFRTANILQEVSTKLSSGIKTIEVTAIQPDVFDSIPTQQLKEVNRLSKLTGVDITLHGPLIEASGISQQGFSEAERESAERKIQNALLRSHELNPNGNIPVTFHSSSGIPGSQLLPPSQRTEKAGEYRKLIAIDKETGRRMITLEPEPKYYPGSEDLTKAEIHTPKKRIDILNNSEWANSLDQTFFNQERAQEILGKNQVQIQHLMGDLQRIKKETGKIDSNTINNLGPNQRQAWNNFLAAQNYLEDVEKQVINFFSKAYQFGTPEQQHGLRELNNEFIERVKEIRQDGTDPFAKAEAMKFLINELKRSEFTPRIYVPIEEFAIEKSSQTFGTAAFEAYKKFKDKSPITVIENPPAGAGPRLPGGDTRGPPPAGSLAVYPPDDASRGIGGAPRA